VSRRRGLAAGALLAVCAQPAAAVDPREAAVSAAQDNSFLLQEAYNQEAGVVQSIASLEVSEDAGEREWQTLLAQEWPLVSGDHQLSFALPVTVIAGDARSAAGLGDLQLAYRYQLLRESERVPAVAPLFGLSLPTGDESDGLGNGSVGYQLVLPVSKVLADRLAVHANAGLSYTPHVQGHALDDYSLGASAVYTLHPRLNLLLEWVADWQQQVDDGQSDRDFVSRLSPGARFAFELAGGQLVLGLAAPIGTTPESPDWGAFLYLSFERRFWGAAESGGP
jgi:hypothetical protein